MSAARRIIITLIRRLQFAERHLGLAQFILEVSNAQSSLAIVSVQLAHQALALRSKIRWALASIVGDVTRGSSTVRCRVRIHLKISSLAGVLR